MKLSCENIAIIVRHALPASITEAQKELARSGQEVPGFLRGEGVRTRFLFDKAKLEEKRADVIEMLKELPKQFHKDGGGGWSFLNACMTEDGEQWGDHRNLDELLCLGLALGVVEFQLPRDAWKALPGGVPYFSVNVG